MPVFIIKNNSLRNNILLTVHLKMVMVYLKTAQVKNTLLFIWLSNISILNVPDEGYYVPDEGYYVPDEGYYVPDEGYYVSDEGYYVPDEGYYVPDEGYYVPDEGYDVPDEGYYVPDEGYYVPDEGYSRNVSCALHLISTFLSLLYKTFNVVYGKLSKIDGYSVLSPT
jgi:annexin A7/11